MDERQPQSRTQPCQGLFLMVLRCAGQIRGELVVEAANVNETFHTEVRLILTLLCRDEADVVDEMVCFHLAHGVDQVIATDNRSHDATRSILERHQRAGRLLLLDEPSHIHDQASWVTRMARLAVERFGADWVITADADEFWWPQGGNLKTELAGVQAPWQALSVGRSNFLPPDPAAKPGLPFYEVMVVREQQSLNTFGHPLPPKVCHRGLARIAVEDGNHAVRLEGEGLPAPPLAGIEILHVPVRSYGQFERKIRQGAEALASNKRVAHTSIGGTWRHLYDQHWRQGRLGAYYGSLRPDATALQRGLEEGTLIEDLRLRNTLRDLMGAAARGQW